MTVAAVLLDALDSAVARVGSTGSRQATFALGLTVVQGNPVYLVPILRGLAGGGSEQVAEPRSIA